MSEDDARSTYLPDPGGVFASDTHRRVLAHVPLPGDATLELHALGRRINPDPYHGLQHIDDLAAVLGDLEVDGLCEQDENGWGMTTEGLAALCAPAPEKSGPVTPAVIAGLDLGAL